MIIKNVVAITPVWNEPLGMIQGFLENVNQARKKLVDQGIGFRHFFLDDGAINLPEEYSILVRHSKNQGLARTLADGYQAVTALKSLPDLVIRLDCQEHDALQIPFVVDHFAHSQIQALFLPVWYWVNGENRPAMKDITVMIADFIRAMSPIRRETILGIYNQKFPIGYQAFRFSTIKDLLPEIEKGLVAVQGKTGQPATWGLDLLVILLAAYRYPEAVDFVFGGWSEPWLENRGADKILAQQRKAEIMVEVAVELGMPIA